MTEAELCSLCQQGDEAARRTLYETYAKPMLGVCLRYAGDRSTAEDWLHDAFLKIYCSMDKFTYQGEGSLRAWMMTVLHNGIIETLRRQNVLEEAELMDEEMDIADEVDEGIAYDVDDKKLMAMVAQLPVGQRTVFNMFVFDGMSHKEIARRLGIKEKSSSSQLFRARKTLAEKVHAAQRNRRLWWGGMLGLAFIGLLTHYLYIRNNEKPVARVAERQEEQPRRADVPRRSEEESAPAPPAQQGIPRQRVGAVSVSRPLVAKVAAEEVKEETKGADEVKDTADAAPPLTPEDYWALLQERMKEGAEGERLVAKDKPKRWSVNFGVGVNGSLLSDETDLSSGTMTEGFLPNLPSDGTTGSSDSDEENQKKEEGNAPRRIIQGQGTPHVVESKNHLSWSAGVNFRRTLSHGFSFETGLDYTLLTSDIRYVGSSAWHHQQMHYVGIPLRLNYDLSHNVHWTSYLSADGEVERCIFGKQGPYHHTPSTLQWSVGASAGFQYNLTPHFGFYLEPGINYYFNDGTGIPTRRKEAPLMLNVKLGVRWTK